jgi:hypothetical protein
MDRDSPQHFLEIENIQHILSYSNVSKFALSNLLQANEQADLMENYIFMTKILYLILTIGLTLFFGFLPLIWYKNIYHVLGPNFGIVRE